ncbi:MULTISPECIES: S8 family serine peptidase [unclassified Saccharothrix]|uniref:S8 family serine peptidase n=1 Tax=unclassified Saccharothrix TaxID=2593673 RepID=UPI00307D820C
MSRRSRRLWAVALAVGGVVGAVVSAPGATGAPEGGLSPLGAGLARGADGEVTLVTGDRVVVRDGRVSVVPGAGRQGVGFAVSTDHDGSTHVVPDDVVADLAADRLDPRLFDVGALIRDGYDDARTDKTPLIVTGDTARIAGGQALASVRGVAVEADKKLPFWSSASTGKVWLDAPVRASLDRSVPQIGAPEAWRAGHTGAGTKVAVLDTGIDVTHPDLADAVVDSAVFVASDNTDDHVGHGTHVAATITGAGRYQGVAPDAKLLNGKVLDDTGWGKESEAIAGMEWAVAAGADVVNMSLGSSRPSDGTDPLSQAVNRLTAETGTLFVVSAGNSGPGAGTIGSPGAADAALTVGAVDRDDALAEFSSRGPRLGGGALKPDLTAPGVDIVAAKARNGTIGTPAGDGHVALSGTSMAAPHVAGAAAVLAGQHPDWTADRLKAALTGSAEPAPGVSAHHQGSGRLDVARASRQSTTASPSSLDIGTARWPHHDDAPLTRTVTYTNDGATPATLRVSADVRGPGGTPAPAGVVTASPAEVTVPAGGRAEVTITTTTSLDAPDGDYSGTVLAAGDGVELRTPLVFTKEVESYDVKLTAIDHSGQPAAYFYNRFADLEQPIRYSGYDAVETVRRVPKGRYFFSASLPTQIDGQWWNTTFGEPAFVVDRDLHLPLDARQGKRNSAAVERPNARVGYTEMLLQVRAAWGGTNIGDFSEDFDRRLWVPSTTSSPGSARYAVMARMAEPDGAGGFVGSPYQYNLFWTHDGGVPQDLHRAFADRDLARVDTVNAAQAPGKMGYRDYLAGGPMPLRVTEYYSPDATWSTSFSQMRMEEGYRETTLLTARGRTFEAGTTRTERWNAAVFGPALPATDLPDRWAGRKGDVMNFDIPMYTDQGDARYGYSTTTKAYTELFKDGVRIGGIASDGAGTANVPAEPGKYELTVQASRSEVAELSTDISAKWTFGSAHVPGDPTPLPLFVVRFAPLLDDHNRARAGAPLAIPVYAQRNGGASTDGVQTTEVQVSYDDGKTWRPAPLTRIGKRWLALVHHPAGAKFVSLKAKAHDGDGNAFEQTIIRAYGLK